MPFAFMLEKGRIGSVFVLRKLLEAYQVKEKKLYICFLNQEIAFDRVARKVSERAAIKRGIPDVWLDQ